MTDAMFHCYLAGWTLTSSASAIVASHAGCSRWLSILAGAVWPVLAVAVAQMLVIAFVVTILRSTTAETTGTTKVTSRVDPIFVKTV